MRVVWSASPGLFLRFYLDSKVCGIGRRRNFQEIRVTLFHFLELRAKSVMKRATMMVRFGVPVRVLLNKLNPAKFNQSRAG